MDRREDFPDDLARRRVRAEALRLVAVEKKRSDRQQVFVLAFIAVVIFVCIMTALLPLRR